MFGIHIVNIFLTIITLGVYYFWGKVRVRSYLLSETEFEGDRFAYHGTGKELLIGFLKAMLVFGLPLGILRVLPELLDMGVLVKAVAGLLASAIVMVFFPVAMVGARRYRLSRASWREIRFSFRGRAGEFLKIFLKAALLTGLTFGLYYPFFDTKRYAFMTSHAYLGNQKFDFDGQGRDLFWSFVLTLLLTVPTLGLCWFWFLAKKQRYFWDHTTFGGARFHSTVTGGRLFLLRLGICSCCSSPSAWAGPGSWRATPGSPASTSRSTAPWTWRASSRKRRRFPPSARGSPASWTWISPSASSPPPPTRRAAPPSTPPAGRHLLTLTRRRRDAAAGTDHR
jgi:uncharacterized membrane protein YjgN (DUF898 family)